MDYELTNSVRQHLHAANHLLNKTYPLTKDPKIFLAVIINLIAAIKLVKRANNKLGNKEANQKRSINHQPKLLKLQKLLLSLQDIQTWHKDCDVEFKRGQQWVMCTEKYTLHVLTLSKTEKLFNKTCSLLEEFFAQKTERHKK